MSAADVHVDWEITAAEWEQLRSVLLARPDVPFCADLAAAGALAAGAQGA